MERSLKHLLKYKSYFGFADWELKLDDRTDEDSTTIARCAIDLKEKRLKVILYALFIDEDTDKNNVLIHELIHARHEVKAKRFQERSFEMEYQEEEDMVNDITRGFMKVLADGVKKEERKKVKR